MMAEDSDKRSGGESNRSERLDRLARLLVDAFGARAIEIADGQAAGGGADVAVSAVWRELSARAAQIMPR